MGLTYFVLVLVVAPLFVFRLFDFCWLCWLFVYLLSFNNLIICGKHTMSGFVFTRQGNSRPCLMTVNANNPNSKMSWNKQAASGRPGTSPNGPVCWCDQFAPRAYGPTADSATQRGFLVSVQIRVTARWRGCVMFSTTFGDLYWISGSFSHLVSKHPCCYLLSIK